MKATRVDHVSDLWGDDGVDGGYCPVIRDGVRTWMVRTPNGHLGDLSAHDVTENDDGTITVSPSILISSPQQGDLYHGFLRYGEWTP
ncbi:MAG TPA: hypothetical protein VF170_09485 [Planctomycetaceae bacterium]